MKRVLPLLVAAAALLWLDVGSAQQSPAVHFAATTIAELRTWDGYVTARERAGELQVISVDRDPSMPDREVQRFQQYHQGVQVWGAQVVRDSTTGVPDSIVGELLPSLNVDTQPVS